MGNALRAGGRAINIPGLAEGAVEEPALRWRHGVGFNLPNGKRHYIVSGPIHYRDGGGNWQEYDLRPKVPPVASGYDWTVDGADYLLWLRRQANAAGLLCCEQGGKYVELSPVALREKSGAVIASTKPVLGGRHLGSATGLTQQGRIKWVDAFGAGIDLELEALEGRVAKRVIVRQLPVIGGDELHVRWRFDTDAKLTVNGKTWQGSTVQTAEPIVSDGGWRWRLPRATDAARNICKGTKLRLEADGGQTYVTAVLPAAWVRSATLPIEIDPETVYGETSDGYIVGYDGNYAAARLTCDIHDVTATAGAVGQYLLAAVYYIYRMFLEFDTSGLVGTVAQANLYLSLEVDGSAADFDVDIHKCTWTSPITAGNREANYDAALASAKDVTWRNTAGIALHTAYGSPNLDTSWIVTDGMTQFALLSAKDTGSTAPTGEERVWIHTQEEATQEYRPRLLVEIAVHPTMRRWGGVPHMMPGPHSPARRAA